MNHYVKCAPVFKDAIFFIQVYVTDVVNDKKHHMKNSRSVLVNCFDCHNCWLGTITGLLCTD